MSAGQFDSEDFVTYGGRAHHRSVIHQKIASMGWSVEQTKQLTDEQVKQVIEQRLSPDQVQVAQTAPGSSVVLMNDPAAEDLDADEAAIMGVETPAQPTSGIVMEQQVAPPATPQRRLTGVKPPGQAAPATQAQQPAAPTIGSRPAPEPEPAPAPAPPPPPKPAAPVLPKPATDLKQFKALLDAIVALSTNDATYAQASALATAHDLWDALKAYNADVYGTLGGDGQERFGPPADEVCIGGMILKTEVANGAIHILTTEGTLTLTGSNINLCKQQ